MLVSPNRINTPPSGTGKGNEMNQASKEMIRGWLAKHHGDVEGVVKFMAYTLRIGGMKACRALVSEALV